MRGYVAQVATPGIDAAYEAASTVSYSPLEYLRRLLTVFAAFVFAPTLGLLAAFLFTYEKWRFDDNAMAVLAAAITVLAVLHVTEFLGRDPDNKKPDASMAPLQSARWLTGFWAVVAIATILVHIAVQSDDAEALETSITRFLAVYLAVTAFGSRLTLSATRSLLTSYKTPAKPVTRLVAGVIDLVVPAAVVAGAWACIQSWTRHWLGASAVVFVVVTVWLALLARAGGAGGKRRTGLRIVGIDHESGAPSNRLRWDSALVRSALVAGALAIPAGNFYTDILERGDAASATATPTAVFFLGTAFGFVLLVSHIARDDGRGIHDLVARTVVLPVDRDDSGTAEPGQRVWAPYW